MLKLSAPDAIAVLITLLVITLFSLSLFSCASPATQTTTPLIANQPLAALPTKPEHSYPTTIPALTPTTTSTTTSTSSSSSSTTTYEKPISEFTLPSIGDSPTATLRLVLSEPAHLSDSLQDLLGVELFEKPNHPSAVPSVGLPNLPFRWIGDDGWTMNKPCNPEWDPVTYQTDEGIIVHSRFGGFEFNSWRYEHIQSIYRDCGDYTEPADIGRWQPMLVSDGTLESTNLLKFTDKILVDMGTHIVFNSRMFFDARTTGSVSSDYSECAVWRTDGPPESLQPILGDGCTGRRGGPRYLLAISRDRLFIGLADKFGGKQLFQSNGTKESTQQIANLGTYGYNLREMIVADERLYLLMEQRLLAYDIVVE